MCPPPALERTDGGSGVGVGGCSPHARCAGRTVPSLCEPCRGGGWAALVLPVRSAHAVELYGPSRGLRVENAPVSRPCSMAVTGSIKLTYTKNPSRPSSLKIFPMELNTPLWRTQGTRGHRAPVRSPYPGGEHSPPPLLRAIRSWPGQGGDILCHQAEPKWRRPQPLFGGEGRIDTVH